MSDIIALSRAAAEKKHYIKESFKGNSVLLLDGDSRQRFLLQTLLKAKLGYHVHEIDPAIEISQWCGEAEGVLEAIVLDASTISEPLMMIAQCKSKLPDVPVIVLVKYGDYQFAAETLLAGAYGFLTKPVAEERMGVTLCNAIEVARMRQNMKNANPVSPLQANAVAPETFISLLNTNGDARRIDEIEQAVIQFAIRLYNGRMTEVARKLGIGRSTLYRKLGAG